MCSDYQGWQDRRGNAALWDDDGGLAGIGRLAEGAWDRTCGDGVNRCLLEAGVEYFGGGGIRSAAGERARSQHCARAQDRSEGQPVDRRFAPARVVAQEFRATSTGSRSSRVAAGVGRTRDGTPSFSDRSALAADGISGEPNAPV